MPTKLNVSALTHALNQLPDDIGEPLYKELKTTLVMLIAKEAVALEHADLSTPWSPDDSNLHLCSSVDDVKAMVLKAHAEKKTLRVAGAQHSAPQAVFDRQAQEVHIKLEGELRKITVLENNTEKGFLRVKAGAGANLGINPSDPNSNAENSFNRVVDALGYALPILGGMSHQTLGGFMMTSTAGGSLSYGFGDSLEAFELVDGHGKLRAFTKGTDDFDAAAVSFGLFGVITSVTLKLDKRYLVKGTEETVRTADSILASGEALKMALEKNTYVHAVWFAQPGVDRVLQFRAEQAPETEELVPYVHVLHDPLQNYFAALALYLVDLLYAAQSEPLRKLADGLLDLMSPISEEPTKFCDHWYLALPNDDQAMIDQLIRVQFTEIWVDIDKTSEVYNALKELFAQDSDAVGNFGVEVYCAKASKFWMSPSYQRNVIRIDPYWWEFNPTGTLDSFFEKYWKVILPIATSRLHWGKHFPKIGSQYGNRTIGPDYVRQSYPKFDEWLQRREEFDPHQVFVTSYWRSMFGIDSKA